MPGMMLKSVTNNTGEGSPKHRFTPVEKNRSRPVHRLPFAEFNVALEQRAVVQQGPHGSCKSPGRVHATSEAAEPPASTGVTRDVLLCSFQLSPHLPNASVFRHSPRFLTTMSHSSAISLSRRVTPRKGARELFSADRVRLLSSYPVHRRSTLWGAAFESG